MKCGNSRSAFTLLELLVAVAIFVVLVGFLVAFVQSFEESWRRGERRSQLYAEAREIWTCLQRDLSAIWLPHPTSRPAPTGLVVDFLPREGTVRLRLLRVFSERHWLVASQGGNGLYPDRYLDLEDDWREARELRLLPTNGAAEVVYWLEPFGDNYRLVRSLLAPPGGKNSFFLPSFLKPKGKQILSQRVLYWEVRSWHRRTQSWAIPWGQQSQELWLQAPSLIWDSTRQLLPSSAYPPEWQFLPFFQPGLPILPRALQVWLVLAREEKLAELARPVTAQDQTLYIHGAHRLPQGNLEVQVVRVGREWVRYEERGSRYIVVGAQGARGARMSQPSAHPAGTKVDSGQTFVWTFSLP